MRRVLRRLWPRSQTWRAATITALILLPIAAAFVAFVDDWSDVSRVKDVAGAIQSAVTVIAIVTGGIFALFKLQAFRDFEPHLTVSHEVTHRFVGDGHVHIVVITSLKNSSRVKIDLSKGIARLQQIAPVSDEEFRTLYDQVFANHEFVDIQWPTLHETLREWGRGELLVEPSETHRETYEFIVSKDVESVMIDTYFYNPMYPGSSHTPEGWGLVSVYDIVSHG